MDVLVPLTNTPADTSAMQLAAALVGARGGHVTLVQPVESPLPDTAYVKVPPRVATLARRVAQWSVPYDIQIEEGRAERPVDAISMFAQRFDQVIMACSGHDRAERRLQHAQFSSLVSRSGRPIIALPGRTRFDGIFKRAVIGWSATPESARAAHDFLRLDFECSLVVTTVDGSDRVHEHAQAFVNSLVRQGREATFASLSSNGRSVADVLQGHALDSQADLLVCGAYGHSRAHEWLLGGATKALFEYTLTPLFFSR
ncbi:hypothetical protein ACPEH1_08845 [Stenotrophomonas sp. NPDC077421]|uniref:hypothetical protein n=1 Tax=Stenotrophomonas sp. NPDC077421 TaxID=3414699 RepID=UPI003C2ADA2F